MIYLASPYSHPDLYVMQLRYETACKVTAHFMKDGKLIYSPIVHNHVLARQYSMPTGFEYWHRHDLSMLDRCSELYVLMSRGWDISVGVANEVEHAKQSNKPIKYIDYPIP
jgi:hypothetical protein